MPQTKIPAMRNCPQVRIGLEGQEQRENEFFKKLRANLEDNDPKHEDQLVDEFRNLILSR